MKNKAMFMKKLRSMEMQEIEMPQLKSKDVLVKIQYVGICGSDLHFYEMGRIGDYVVNGDFILGHECSGVIVDVGDDVTGLKIGDRVALEPGITCGTCQYCTSGKYNLCPSVEFLATPPYHGSLKNYIAFPENMCFKLPDNVSTMDGALIEPLAVGFHAANQGGVKDGDTVIILGAGCIGLVTLLACKAKGAKKIIMVDLIDSRLEAAKRLGADIIINPNNADVTAEVSKICDGGDVIIESAGAVAAVQSTAYLVKRGGSIVLVGLAPENEIKFDFMQIMNKEAEIKTVFRYRYIYPEAIKAVADRKIDIKGIVSHKFKFEDSKEAFDFALENKTEVIKAVIELE